VSDNWQAVGEAVRAGEAERGWDHGELGRRADVTESTIRQMVNHPGKRHQNANTLKAISLALRRPPDYLSKILKGDPTAELTPALPDGETAQRVPDAMAVQFLEQFLRNTIELVQQHYRGVVDVTYNSDSELDVTIQIKNAGADQ
jgi:hypothetical protein